MKAPLKREVDAAAGAYGDALVRWGENNMLTQRKFQTYWELRTRWEASTGRKYGAR